MVDKTARFFIVILSLFSIWVVITNVKNVRNIKIQNQNVVDSLHMVVDSLNNELFIQTTNVTRYEIALDRLKEVDSISAKKFEDELSNTE